MSEKLTTHRECGREAPSNEYAPCPRKMGHDGPCAHDFEGGLAPPVLMVPILTANPKDQVGSSKAPMSTVSSAATAEAGVAMLEGALKYGRHNYRKAPIRASVYFDATARHMRSWWEEGQDIDPDSGLHHITKAIATLLVLRDSMITGQWDDDRPPPVPAGFFAELDKQAAALVAKYPQPKSPVRADGR